MEIVEQYPRGTKESNTYHILNGWRGRHENSVFDVGRNSTLSISVQRLMKMEKCAIEVEEGKEKEVLECKIVGLCGVTEEREDKKESRMMMMTGKIEGIPLVVLEDSGASHNFISPAVVSVLGLKVDSIHQIEGVSCLWSHNSISSPC